MMAATSVGSTSAAVAKRICLTPASSAPPSTHPRAVANVVSTEMRFGITASTQSGRAAAAVASSAINRARDAGVTALRKRK